MRFAILYHSTPPGVDRGPHWDFLCEVGDLLWTWALEKTPDSGEPQTAMRLPDHRRLYLEYEGRLSAGRGTVTRWDSGECDLVESTSEHVVLDLRGDKIRGRATLTPCDEEKDAWEWKLGSNS